MCYFFAFFFVSVVFFSVCFISLAHFPLICCWPLFNYCSLLYYMSLCVVIMCVHTASQFFKRKTPNEERASYWVREGETGKDVKSFGLWNATRLLLSWWNVCIEVVRFWLRNVYTIQFSRVFVFVVVVVHVRSKSCSSSSNNNAATSIFRDHYIWFDRFVSTPFQWLSHSHC